MSACSFMITDVYDYSNIYQLQGKHLPAAAYGSLFYFGDFFFARIERYMIVLIYLGLAMTYSPTA